MKPGHETSEHKLSVRTILALLVTVLSTIAASGFFPDEHLALKIISAAVAVAGTLGIGGVASSYNRSREAVKIAAYSAKREDVEGE